MPRQRFIWPDLWTDPGFSTLEPVAQVLYIGCFSNADDEGRLLGDASFLKATIFPRKRVSKAKVKRARDDTISAMSQLVLYEHSGVEYLAFTNWKAWQKPKYPTPSRLPAPPELVPEDSGNDSGNPSGNGSGNDSSTGWVGLGWDKKTLLPSTALQDPEEGRHDPEAEYTPRELDELAASLLEDMPS